MDLASLSFIHRTFHSRQMALYISNKFPTCAKTNHLLCCSSPIVFKPSAHFTSASILMPKKRTSKASRKSKKSAGGLTQHRKFLPQIRDNPEFGHKFQFAETWRIKITSYAYIVVATHRRYPQHRRSIVQSHIILGILILASLTKSGSIFWLSYSIFKVHIGLIAVVLGLIVHHVPK